VYGLTNTIPGFGVAGSQFQEVNAWTKVDRLRRYPAERSSGIEVVVFFMSKNTYPVISSRKFEEYHVFPSEVGCSIGTIVSAGIIPGESGILSLCSRQRTEGKVIGGSKFSSGETGAAAFTEVVGESTQSVDRQAVIEEIFVERQQDVDSYVSTARITLLITTFFHPLCTPGCFSFKCKRFIGYTRTQCQQERFTQFPV